MLIIKTRKKNSLIENAGIGLFTTEYIEKGEVVWKRDITDIAILRDEYKELEVKGLAEWVEKYGTQEIDGSWFLDGDDCKYMNHSKTPNILFLDYVGVALRDIEINEELYCDYSTITTIEHYKKLLTI